MVPLNPNHFFFFLVFIQLYFFVCNWTFDARCIWRGSDIVMWQYIIRQCKCYQISWIKKREKTFLQFDNTLHRLQWKIAPVMYQHANKPNLVDFSRQTHNSHYQYIMVYLDSICTLNSAFAIVNSVARACPYTHTHAYSLITFIYFSEFIEQNAGNHMHLHDLFYTTQNAISLSKE